MNEELLWEKFAESGKVSDYLSYCTSKKGTEKEHDSVGGNRS